MPDPTETLQEIREAVGRIETRIAGDKRLHSRGLVHDVEDLQKGGQEMARILERVVVKVDELENHRVSQIRVNKRLFATVRPIKMARVAVAAATATVVFVVGILAWGWQSGFFRAILISTVSP